jgi:hypothetical protein
MKFALFWHGRVPPTIVARRWARRSSSAAGTALLAGSALDGAEDATLFVLVYWIRWSLLRFRSDQPMGLCWKYLVPASVLWWAPPPPGWCSR